MASIVGERSVRRFNLGDGLILIRAFLISLVALRSAHWFETFPATVVWCCRAIAELLGQSPWTFPNQTREYVGRWVALRIVDELLVKLLILRALGAHAGATLVPVAAPSAPLGKTDPATWVCRLSGCHRRNARLGRPRVGRFGPGVSVGDSGRVLFFALAYPGCAPLCARSRAGSIGWVD